MDDNFKNDQNLFNAQCMVYRFCIICRKVEEVLEPVFSTSKKEIVCKMCKQDAELKSFRLGISAEEYLDSLIVMKKMSESDKHDNIEGHKVNVKIRKRPVK